MKKHWPSWHTSSLGVFLGGVFQGAPTRQHLGTAKCCRGHAACRGWQHILGTPLFFWWGGGVDNLSFGFKIFPVSRFFFFLLFTCLFGASVFFTAFPVSGCVQGNTGEVFEPSDVAGWIGYLVLHFTYSYLLEVVSFLSFCVRLFFCSLNTSNVPGACRNFIFALIKYLLLLLLLLLLLVVVVVVVVLLTLLLLALLLAVI